MPLAPHEHEALVAALRSVKERIAAAAARARRREADIRLVAVTKSASIDQIVDLLDLGHTDLGESQAQQLTQRQLALRQARPLDADRIHWHMIGHLQRNKIHLLAPVVHVIHSVDNLRVAEDLQTLCCQRETSLDILVQVNASGEESKFGVAAAAVPHFAEQIDTMANLRLRGLMTMAPYSANPDDARPTFARTAELFHDLRSAGVGGEHLNILSMGMSGDFEVAIEEGSNLVRIGTALFGDHPTQA